MKKLFLTVVMTAGLVFNIQSAVAASYSQQSALTFLATDKTAQSRGYYENQVNPGDVKTYTFVVKNNSDTPESFSYYPSDCIPKLNGGKDLRGATDKNVFVGTWSTDSVQKITLAPGQSKDLIMHIKVPRQLNPGQYILYSAIEEEPKSAQGTVSNGVSTATLNAKILNKTGIQIVMNYKLDEVKHSLSATGLNLVTQSDGIMDLLFSLKNSGGILEKPTGNITITDEKDSVFYKGDYQADSIYAGTTAQISLTPNKIFSAGDYNAIIVSNYNGETVKNSFKFSITKEQEKQTVSQLTDSGKIALPPGYNTGLFGLSSTAWMYLFGGLIIVVSIILVVVLTGKNKPDSKRNGKTVGSTPAKKRSAATNKGVVKEQ